MATKTVQRTNLNNITNEKEINQSCKTVCVCMCFEHVSFVLFGAKEQLQCRHSTRSRDTRIFMTDIYIKKYRFQIEKEKTTASVSDSLGGLS